MHPDRGRIFDRSGKIVADNEHTYRITLVKEEARDVDGVLAKLQRLLGLTGEVIDRIREQLDRVRGFVPVTVKDRVTWEELSIIALNTPALPGVPPGDGPVRIIPSGQTLPIRSAMWDPSATAISQPMTGNPIRFCARRTTRSARRRLSRIHKRALRGEPGAQRVEVNAGGRTMRELALIRRPPARTCRSHWIIICRTSCVCASKDKARRQS